jgi:lipid-A-disaccharide synthase
MLNAAQRIAAKKEIEIVVGIAPTLEEQYFRTLYRMKNVRLISGLTYDVIANADFAFVTSGTATLETACFSTPMFVVYKTSWLTYCIGRLLVHVKNIGLVNIVAGKTIVPEFIQYRANAKTLAKEALKLLNNEKQLTEMKTELSKVKGMLGSFGASKRVAERILQMA